MIFYCNIPDNSFEFKTYSYVSWVNILEEYFTNFCVISLYTLGCIRVKDAALNFKLNNCCLVNKCHMILSNVIYHLSVTVLMCVIKSLQYDSIYHILVYKKWILGIHMYRVLRQGSCTVWLVGLKVNTKILRTVAS